MDYIPLYKNKEAAYTKVSNSFIDRFMTEANEAQIKIYLYLLRSVVSGADISVAAIADRFNYTERDILRALFYWDKKGLITLDYNESGSVRGICLNDIEKHVYHDEDVQKQEVLPAPARPFYSAGQIREFQNNGEVKGLLFMTEQYLGHPLNNSEFSSILYIYDSLHFSVDLIEYLIDHCVNSGHKHMKYIETVARDWDSRGIRSVEEAKYETGIKNKEYYEVLKAFGLSGRNPVKSEMDYIRKWRDEYGFSSDLIIEAVNRTMNTISKPSFQYADTILQRWKQNHLTNLSEIEDADRSHKPVKKEMTTKFSNFTERNYDFSELEKKFTRN